jgi:hypothetical protein
VILSFLMKIARAISQILISEKTCLNFCEYFRMNLALKYGSCIFRTQQIFPIVLKKCKIFYTSGFWPRLRAPYAARTRLFGFTATPKRGAARPPDHRSFDAPPIIKNKLFSEQNVFLQAQTRAARGIYFSTGLSCTLLSYAAPY